MRKCIVVALCAVLVLSIAACGGKTGQTAIGGDPATWGPAVDGDPKVPAEPSGGNVEIPNPFEEYETLADAAAAVGFEISVPDSLEGYSGRSIRASACNDLKMIEVIYSEEEGGEVRVRKASGADDISGDYNRYDRTGTATVGEYNVTLKGNGDAVHLATWTADGYSYSVSFSAGVAEDTITRVIASVE